MTDAASDPRSLDEIQARGYERLRASGVKAIHVLWPHRYELPSARAAIRDVIFNLRQARYGR